MELIFIFSIAYITQGIVYSVVIFYTNDFSITVDEFLIVLFFWPLILYNVVKENGWIQIIKEGLIDDKKGFFNRVFIMIAVLIIFYSIVNFIDGLL